MKIKLKLHHGTNERTCVCTQKTCVNFIPQTHTQANKLTAADKNQ